MNKETKQQNSTAQCAIQNVVCSAFRKLADPTKMILNARTKWGGDCCKIRPVFFAWHVGLEYKTVEGPLSGSIFCNKRDNYIFPVQTELIMLYVKLYYWFKMYAYKQVRYWIPAKIKRALKPKKVRAGDLPF